MRKYSYKVKNNNGQIVEMTTFARTKAEAINSLKTTDFLINGEIYELVKNSFRWVNEWGC